MVWKLVRTVSENQQHVPAWSALNAFTSDTACPVVSVLPSSGNHPQNRPPSIHLWYNFYSLLQNWDKTSYLWAIFTSKRNKLWSKPPPLQGKSTMRPRGMHIMMAYLASIEKLCGEFSIFDILTESDVICREHNSTVASRTTAGKMKKVHKAGFWGPVQDL